MILHNIRQLFICTFIALFSMMLSSCGGSGSSTPNLSYSEVTQIVNSDAATISVGMLQVKFSADSLREPHEIKVRLHHNQLDRSPVHKNLGSSLSVRLPASISECTSLTFSMPFSATSTGDVLLAQQSVSGISFPQVDVTTFGSELSFTLSDDTLADALSEAVEEGSHRWLTFSLAERIHSSASGRGDTFDGHLLKFVPGGPHNQIEFGFFEIYNQPNGLAGKKIAVIVHGLNNSSNDMLDTYKDVVTELYPVGDARSYDLVLFYEYKDTTEGIAENGRRLSDRLEQYGGASATQIDFHGHSMGGLVSRWAIEHQSIGAAATRLFAYGTPHRGVPYRIVKASAWYSFVVEGYRDLYWGSAFLRDLSASESPHRNFITYYLLAGTSPDYLMPIGAISSQRYIKEGESLFRNPNYFLPHDGIVSIWSAHPADISRFGKVSNGSLRSLSKNHSDIASGNDVLATVQEMLRASGSGVIR